MAGLRWVISNMAALKFFIGLALVVAFGLLHGHEEQTLRADICAYACDDVLDRSPASVLPFDDTAGGLPLSSALVSVMQLVLVLVCLSLFV